MTIRLIASDLDGTLLGPDGRIAPADAAAVLDAARAGVVIVVATGRPVRWLDCLAPITDAAPYVIASNGAVVWDVTHRRVVRNAPLRRPLIADLARDLAAAIPGLTFALEEGDVFGCEPAWRGHPPDTSRTSATEEADTVRAPLAELMGRTGDVVKFLAAHPDHDPDELVAAAQAIIGERAVVTHSVTTGRRALLEISAAGVSKATELARLCADLGIAPAEVAAFGDMPNDVAMLEFAGRGFAMGNAHPLLRERFEVVGTHGAGGVGMQVRRLLRDAQA